MTTIPSRAAHGALAALLLAILCALPAAGQPSVTGRVVGSEGDPVAGARVELRSLIGDHVSAEADLSDRFTAPSVAGATTGDDGRFALDAPRVGLWDVVVNAPGMAPEALLVGPLFEPTALPPIVLGDGRELAVRVVDATGEPVRGALVVAARSRSPRFRGLLRSDRRRARSDADGRLELPARVGETVHLTAAAPGHAPAWAESDGDAVTLRLAAGRPLQLSVVDADGEPVAGATVTALPGDAERGDPVAIGLSGDDGGLTVHFDPQAGLRLAARDRAGRHTDLVPLPESGADGEPPRRLTLVLAPPPVLTGHTLAAPDGAPLAGTWVWSTTAPEAAAVSDGEGAFSLPLVGGRNHTLRAGAKGYGPTAERLDPSDPAAGSPLTLQLVPTTGLAGRVVDGEGRGIDGAEVVATPLSTGLRSHTLNSARGATHRALSDGGDFRLRGLDHRQAYELRATADGFAPATVEVGGLDAVAEEGVEIVLEPGVVAFGRVLDGDETPVAGARVVLSSAENASFGNLIGAFAGADLTAPRAESGDGGGFELRDLAPGRYDLTVEASGFAPQRVPGVELPEGAVEVDLGSVLLTPGAVVEGRVHDDHRRPVAGAEVSWTPAIGIGMLFARSAGSKAVTDDEGRFRIVDLAPGEALDLRVQAAGYGEQVVQGVRAPSEEPLTVVLEPAASLAGTVVDESGAPVSTAVLMVHGPPGSMSVQSYPSTRSDDDGGFQLTGLPAGEVKLTVQASGFMTLERKLEDLAAGEERRGVRLVLQRGATVAGRVVDDAGEPVPGASIQLITAGNAAASFAGNRAAVTDADGRYTLEGVPVERLSFAATAAGHLRAVRDLDVRPGDNDLGFRLEAGLSISGRVVDEAGSPVLGASVGTGNDLPALITGSGETTDADGRFTLSGVEPGTHTLHARKDGYAATTREGVEATATVDGVELVLRRGARVVGQLLGVEPELLSRLRVLASPAGRPTLPAIGTVDFEGGYRVEGLSPGAWQVIAIGEDGRMVHGEVTVGDGDREVRLDLDLGGGHRLSGRVTVGGRPLAGAMVIATGREQAANAFGSSDQDGRFSLSGLAPGSYTLRIQDRTNPSQGYEREVRLEGDLDLDLDFAAVEVTGRVTDRASGAPLAGAEVRLVATGGELAGLAGLGHGPQTVTDEAGRFRFTAVAAGDYRVRAERDGYAAAEVALSLADGPATGGVELALEPTRGLALRVLSSHGTLPERVMVAALPPGEPPVGSVLHPVFAASVTPGEEGRLVLDRLPAGSWRLIVAGDGLATVERRVTAPGPEVAVALPPAASLDLAVASLVDTGTYGSARLRGADGSVWIGVDAAGQPRADWPLFGGRTRVDHLPAGAWSVEITTPEGPPLSGRVETAPGTASRLRIE